MSKSKLVLCTVFLLFAGGVSLFYFAKTPKFALYEIVYAVKTKDQARFEKRVDINGIADTLIEEVVLELNKNGNGRAGMFARLIKPRVGQWVHQQLNEAIFKQRSEVAGSQFTDAPGLGAFSQVTRGISFKALGVTYPDGEYMVTPAKFQHEASQKEITLDLKMKKENGGWRLVQVGNLVEAFRSLRGADSGNSKREVSEVPQAPVGD